MNDVNRYVVLPVQPASGGCYDIGEDDVPHLAGYTAHMRRQNLKPTTMRRRRSTLHRADQWLHLRHGTTLNGATVDHLEEWLDSLKVSSVSRHHYRSDLAAYYTWAMSHGHTDRNTAVHLARPRLPRGLPRPIRTEDLLIADQEADPRMRAIIRLAAYAGLRCAEISQLDVLDLDFYRESIMVRNGKGGKDRALPLHPKIREALNQYGAPRSSWLFPTRSGSAYDPSTVSGMASRHFRDLGMQWTLHSCRHWFGSEVYRASHNDIRAVQELLGHSSVQTTQIYTAWDHGKARAAVLSLDTKEGTPA